MPFVRSSETQLGYQLTSPGKSTAVLDTNWEMVENCFSALQHTTLALIIQNYDTVLQQTPVPIIYQEVVMQLAPIQTTAATIIPRSLLLDWPNLD